MSEDGPYSSVEEKKKSDELWRGVGAEELAYCRSKMLARGEIVWQPQIAALGDVLSTKEKEAS